MTPAPWGVTLRQYRDLLADHVRPQMGRFALLTILLFSRVAAQGTLEELLASSEEMQRLWRGDV